MFRLKVKEVAEQKGMSRRRLFLRSGVDIRTVRRVFNDPSSVITVETLDRLAIALGVDVSELIESVPPDKASQVNPPIVENDEDKKKDE